MSMRNHPFYGNEQDMLPLCTNYYQSFYGDGMHHYVKCTRQNHPRWGDGCYPENKCTSTTHPRSCNGKIKKHYCPPTPEHPMERVLKERAKDPDVHQEIQDEEDPDNKGKWGEWAINFLTTSVERHGCPSFSWTPPRLTNYDDNGAAVMPELGGCKAYRNSQTAPIDEQLVESSSVSSVGQAKDHEDQEITAYDECGDDSTITVTIFGAANLGYGDAERTLYAYETGGGCATNLAAAQAVETWEWPLLRVHHNMLYNYIASSSYEDDGSNGYTRYLKVNDCFAFLSVHDSNQIPTQRSATWPTFDVDGNLVASNPC